GGGGGAPPPRKNGGGRPTILRVCGAQKRNPTKKKNFTNRRETPEILEISPPQQTAPPACNTLSSERRHSFFSSLISILRKRVLPIQLCSPMRPLERFRPGTLLTWSSKLFRSVCSTFSPLTITRSAELRYSISNWSHSLTGFSVDTRSMARPYRAPVLCMRCWLA